MRVRKQYDYTGDIQYFVTPNNVTAIFVELYGAPGGFCIAGAYGVSNGSTGPNAVPPSGSSGAVASGRERALVGYQAGTISVAFGAQYQFNVGGGGGHGCQNGGANQAGALGGWNGGGNSGSRGNTQLGGAIAGAGGGATDFRTGPGIYDRILIAGGGGGASDSANASISASQDPNTPNPPYTLVVGQTYYAYYASGGAAYGGAGGGLTAMSGGEASGTDSNGSVNGVSGSGGGGGAQNNQGGAGGYNIVYYTNPQTGQQAYTISQGSAGGLGQGGTGAAVNTVGNRASGGGGGGGAYGGGGGAASVYVGSNNSGYGGGGGGGSNLTTPSILNPVSYEAVYSNVPNGQVFINYNQAPDAPSISSPANNANLASNASFDLNWVFASQVPGATQFGFNVRYQLQGASTWQTISQPGSTQQSYHFAANTFSSGTYNVEVQTIDGNGDASPWTEITLTFGNLPGAPAFYTVHDGQEITGGNVVLGWNIDQGKTQQSYQMTVTDPNGVVNNFNSTTPNTSVTFNQNVNGQYTITLDYNTTDNALYSPQTIIHYTLNLNVPPMPSVLLVEYPDEGQISLQIGNPADPNNPAVYNDIFRTNPFTGIEEQIGWAEPVSSIFIDYSPLTLVPYNYRVRAYSAVGGYTDAT